MGNPYAPPGTTPPRGDGPRSGTPRTDARGPSSPERPTNHEGPPTPERGTTPDEPSAATRRASRRTLRFALALALLMLATMLPFPWRLAGLAVAVPTLVLGFRALTTGAKARTPGGTVPVVLIGLGLTAMLTFQLLRMVFTWDIEASYQECTDGAVTVSATDGCLATYQQSLADWVLELLGPAPERP